MSTMPAGRRAVLIIAVLAALMLTLLVVVAAVPVLVALAIALLALIAALRLRATRSRWRPRRPRRSAQPWPVTPAGPDQVGPTWTTSWPTLPPLHELPVMRGRVRALLTEWEVHDEAAQPTLLVLTELLANAIEHSNAPIRISLGFTTTFVRVQIHDATPQPPQQRPYDPTRIRGHGLKIVEALALRRGWTPEPDGKTVWADVPTDWPESPPSG
jgi:anti-sigma regulatory factor (Ser/Thr protein kinase)